jgi:predicted Zn-dependent peptidase
MEGFSKSYALATTRYGSVDTHLPDGTPLPDGIAHFLEHKMFQTEAGDVFDLYSARGASANAFTTFTHTSYLFASTSRFRENLDTLLETMAGIHTDPLGVEREKGIIGQELAMYEDDPGWRGYFNLLGALYRRHPVRIDIGGTVASIAPIDPEILVRTHAAFYSPANMVIVAAGDVEPAQVLARTEAIFAPLRRGRRNRRRTVAEPRSVGRREVREALSVSRPHVLLGLKDEPARGGLARLRQRVETALGLEVLFGDGGRIQAPLYRGGLVDDSFSAGYESEADWAFAVISAEVDAIEPYRKQLVRAWRAAARAGVTDEEIERCRRRAIGRHLRVFNAPESSAHWLLALALEGQEPAAGVQALRAATAARVSRRLRALAQAPKTWSLLVPREENTAAS